jgi:hypothetical protein
MREKEEEEEEGKELRKSKKEEGKKLRKREEGVREIFIKHISLLEAKSSEIMLLLGIPKAHLLFLLMYLITYIILL